MNTEHLKELVKFSRTLNYTTTSRELYISQPTLSQHITKLEKDLGFSVVTHDGTPNLTVAGDLFCSTVPAIMASLDSLIVECLEVADRERCSVRVADVRHALPIAGDLEAIARSSQGERNSDDGRFGYAYVNSDRLWHTRGLDALDSGLVDVSFAFAPSDDAAWTSESFAEAYDFVKLRSVPCLVRMMAGHPLAQKESVCLANLAASTVVCVNEPFYESCEKSIRERIEEAGIRPSFVMGSPRAKETILAAKEECVAIMLATSLSITSPELFGEFVYKRIADYDLSVQPYAVYRKDNPNPNVRKFAEKWKALLEGEALE